MRKNIILKREDMLSLVVYSKRRSQIRGRRFIVFFKNGSKNGITECPNCGSPVISQCDLEGKCFLSCSKCGWQKTNGSYKVVQNNRIKELQAEAAAN